METKGKFYDSSIELYDSSIELVYDATKTTGKLDVINEEKGEIFLSGFTGKLVVRKTFNLMTPRAGGNGRSSGILAVWSANKDSSEDDGDDTKDASGDDSDAKAGVSGKAKDTSSGGTAKDTGISDGTDTLVEAVIVQTAAATVTDDDRTKPTMPMMKTRGMRKHEKHA